ncbi:uncharacterized protein WM277_027458 [Molossus nigricans]
MEQRSVPLRSDGRPARSPVGVTCASRRGPGARRRSERHDMVRCDGEKGAKPPGLPEHARLEPRGAERPAGLCPLLSGGSHTTLDLQNPRRQEMVLPSSRLGLGPRTSSSPSSSDSRICCTCNHYTPLRNRSRRLSQRTPAPPEVSRTPAAPAP